MERDFMGLGSQHLNKATVKEETPAESAAKDSVTMRNSGGAQWSFSSNKVSAVPQFLSFQTAPEDKPRKSIFDPVASSSFMSISNADTFDSSNKRGSASFLQKNWMEAGSHHRKMAPRPMQQHIDAFPLGSTKDITKFPLSNGHQNAHLSLGTPVLQSHFASTTHSGFRNSMTIQPLGGVPVATPIPVVPASTSSVIGTTEPRNTPKFSGSSAQLTIFYAGSVCVYDEVSPEQAQAVMSMARRSGPSPSRNNKPASTPASQMQPAVQTSLVMDHHFAANKFSKTPPVSSMPSPISVSSSTSSESGTARSLVSSPNIHFEPSSIQTSSCGGPAPIAVGLPQQVRIPQARKASLARFLEKRKERVSSASPYSASKNSSEGNVCA
ncbi:unnamed protein product [Linum trigynum]|uniref:Protein TIFY n=1 Tax=Linum trigynum TaxID=586398 RepID=A0AAV2D8G7_9ROSI